MKIDVMKKLFTTQLLLTILIIIGLNTINISTTFAQENEPANTELDETELDEATNIDKTLAADEESWLEPEEDPVVPTRYQWMVLTGIMALFMMISIKNKAHKLTMDGEFVEYQLTKTFSVPLHKSVFKFALFLTASAALIGFGICLTIFNSVFMPDIIGVFIAGPLFAYLIHLLYLMERHHRETND